MALWAQDPNELWLGQCIIDDSALTYSLHVGYAELIFISVSSVNVRYSSCSPAMHLSDLRC